MQRDYMLFDPHTCSGRDFVELLQIVFPTFGMLLAQVEGFATILRSLPPVLVDIFD